MEDAEVGRGTEYMCRWIEDGFAAWKYLFITVQKGIWIVNVSSKLKARFVEDDDGTHKAPFGVDT